MGMTYSWIVFDRVIKDAVEKRLELREASGQSPLCGAPLERGKFIIFGPLEYFDKHQLQEISKNGSVLLLDYSDTVSFSACVFFKNGEVDWSVVVDGDDQKVEGNAPHESLKRIKEQFEWNDTEPLYIVPVKLGLELVTGVGSDSMPDIRNPVFYEFQSDSLL